MGQLVRLYSSILLNNFLLSIGIGIISNSNKNSIEVDEAKVIDLVIQNILFCETALQNLSNFECPLCSKVEIVFVVDSLVNSKQMISRLLFNV